ncbi:MAG: hypothetical protein R2932_38145 [Caldilineaceae bacterium]
MSIPFLPDQLSYLFMLTVAADLPHHVVGAMADFSGATAGLSSLLSWSP